MAFRLSSIDDLASSQWSLVTRRQLLDADFTRTSIASMLRLGSLRFVRPGVYATLGSVRGWHQDLMAAVLSVGEGSIASHSSAARLWAFVHRPEDGIDVLCKGEFGSVRRDVHRTTILPDDDVAVRDGIPCTSFERTLCDCTSLLTPFQLGRVLDDGLRRREVSLARLQRCALRLDSGPRRRLGVIKVLLAQRDAEFDPGGSASELHVLQVIRDAGLIEPIQQHPVRIGERTYVLDFAWPDRKLFVEYYGLAVHSGASAVAHDSRRLTAMVGEDWRPLIFTDATPDREIVKEVANALSKPPSHGVIAHPGRAQSPPSDGAIEQRRSA
jgi:very-short-patch-repair endonuclease